MRYLILFLLLPFLGISQQKWEHRYENYLSPYHATSESHDFKPSGLPKLFWLLGGRYSAEVCVRFDPNTWFDWILEDGTVDQDVLDWNYKLFGVSPLFEQHNKNGFMFAARPTPDRYHMELCAYKNTDFAFAYESLKTFDVREVYGLYLSIKKSSKNKLQAVATAYDHTGNLLWEVTSKEVDYKWCPSKEIFLWFGGENNAPGKFGGFPSQKVTIFAYKIHSND